MYLNLYVITVSFGEDPHDFSSISFLSEDQAKLMLDQWKSDYNIPQDEYYNVDTDIQVIMRTHRVFVPEHMRSQFNIVT